MTCENAVLLMSGHLDGENSAEEEALLLAHLHRCEDCRRLMSAYEAIEKQTAQLEAPVPQGLKSGVMYRIEQQANPGKQKKRFRYAGTLVGAVAAALVLMVGLGAIRLPALRAKQTEQKTGAEPAREIVSFAPGEQQLLPESLEPQTDNSAGTLYGGMLKDMKIHESNHQLTAGLSDEKQQIASLDVDDRITQDCLGLSQEQGAPVLVYTEFGADSLLSLLKKEEPALYGKLTRQEPQVREDGTVVLHTTYGTLMRIHSWILSHLPETDETALQQAQSRLLERMREITPEGLLTTVITWAEGDRQIDWPANWPRDWADRLRRELNWQLIFPTDAASPMENDQALLVLLPGGER